MCSKSVLFSSFNLCVCVCFFAVSVEGAIKLCCSLHLGKDGRENGLLPHQLSHKSAGERKGLQGDALICGEQRDGTNHTEERSGNATSECA